ncbi:MAG: oligopeptide/dipeptide ABC transporter ATP-binding protein [bacterium]
MSQMLIEVINLRKYFPVKGGVFSRTRGYVKAVDDVSFSIRNGEILGLVGESGCGKTTVGRTILRLLEPTGGKVLFQDIDVSRLKGKSLKSMRRNMQIIFQDPFSSLNPRMTVGSILSEPFKIHKIAKGDSLRSAVEILLEKVGLPANVLNRYPHEFSGGQRQRIGIARALALNPKFVVADEPVSALDVSIQAQIINLLHELKESFNLTLLFIAHDLSVVRHVSDRVAVMYLGRIVELGPTEKLYNDPLHPYTKSLLSAIPQIGRKKPSRIILKGDVPSPQDPPSGCHFHPRCFIADEECSKVVPQLEEKQPGRTVSCIRV